MEYELEEKDIYKDVYFLNWKKRWKERLHKHNKDYEKSIKIMRENNPLVIPRNHKVEEVLSAAEKNDLKPFNEMLKILNNPYIDQKGIIDYQIPSSSMKNFKTFCGT